MKHGLIGSLEVSSASFLGCLDDMIAAAFLMKLD